jgi:hypothetical protein
VVAVSFALDVWAGATGNVLAAAALLLACSSGSRGRGAGPPDPARAWTATSAHYCEYCGGGPEITFAARPRGGDRTRWLDGRFRLCADDTDIPIEANGEESLRLHSVSGGRPERARRGEIRVVRCSESARVLVGTFWVEFDDGIRINGTIDLELAYDSGAE